MDGRKRAQCRGCDKRRAAEETFSWAGYCNTCGPHIRDQQNDDLHYKRGPHFKHWRRQMVASVGGVLLDDVRVSE